MAAGNQNHSVSPPVFFLGSEDNPHYSTISFDIDRYLANCDPVPALPDSPLPGYKKGPGFLLALSLSGFVSHPEVVFFLTRGKDGLVLPSWVQARPDFKYLLSFPSTHSGRAYLDSFGLGRLEIGPHRVVARFWPIIQPRRPSPLPDPPISKSRKSGRIPKSSEVILGSAPPIDPPAEVRSSLLPDLLPVVSSMKSDTLFPNSGFLLHDVGAITHLTPSAPGPSDDSLVSQQIGGGPLDQSRHFCFSPRPSGEGLRVEVLGSRVPPAKATFAYDDGVGGHFEVPLTGPHALALLARSDLFEEFLAVPQGRPILEIERNLACAFAQWFGCSVNPPSRPLL